MVRSEKAKDICMLKERNINKFLETTRRSDVRGYNIYTRGKQELNRLKQGNTTLEQWDAPSLGLPGMISIAHEIDTKDIIVPQIFSGGKKLEFTVMRNRWTPAFMDTMYRCRPFGAYKKSGVLAVRERKCFNEEDTFISHLTLCNDGSEPMQITVKLCVPFQTISEGIYKVHTKIMPASLGQNLFLDGFIYATTNQGTSADVVVPPFGKAEIQYGFAFHAQSLEKAKEALHRVFCESEPFQKSEDRFNAWMDQYVPRLFIDDMDMLKIYYYRFFVIKSAIHTPSDIWPESVFQGACVYESPFGGWFGAPIGLPFPLQIEEMKWMKDTKVLCSQIDNWCEGHGATKGYIQFTPMAVWDVYVHKKDKNLIEKYYESMKQYTLLKCFEDKSMLPKTEGSWITGAEYQPSFYQYTEPKWDWRNDTEGVKDGFERTILHRVDECSMHLLNLAACKNMADLLEKTEDTHFFTEALEEAKKQVISLFWNEEKGFFFDVDVKTGKQCDEAYSYDGCMPMMKQLFGEKYHKVFEHFAKQGCFHADFGLTSVGKQCPMYWFDNCIVGPTEASLDNPHLYGCCWNGPIWPFAVSLVLESLGSAAYENEDLNDLFEMIFKEYTELHFESGDRATPCIVEHYRPTDGAAFSPQAEYFHSEWLNLFLSYYLGICVREEEICIKPMIKEEFILEGIQIHGKSYTISQEYKNGKWEQYIKEIS